MLAETSPNYLQYKIYKRWLLSWIHFIVIIRVTTFECFKMQMVINLAPVSRSNKKVNFYTCPRLSFLKKDCQGKCLQEHFWTSKFQNFPRGVGGGEYAPTERPSGSSLLRSKLASSCPEVWLRPCRLAKHITKQQQQQNPQRSWMHHLIHQHLDRTSHTTVGIVTIKGPFTNLVPRVLSYRVGENPGNEDDLLRVICDD